MSVLKVSRCNAEFGYGTNAAIFQIEDPLPADYWSHPTHAWFPLIRSTIPGLENVWLKYEGSHLSGSFKDRIMSVSIAEILAQHPDCSGMVVPSSGNAAVSAAALCARRGLSMIAIVPVSVPLERLRPIVARGGIVVRAGEGPSQSYALADRMSDALGYARLYSTFASPWAEWGCRSIGRELAAQLSVGISQLISPVSAGPVLVGAANGLVEAGMATPELLAVQAAGCAPIAKAFDEDAETVMPWVSAVNTKAAAIADRLEGYPQDGTRVLHAVRQSGGLVTAVSDQELDAARTALLRHDGLDAEISACAGVAYLMRNPSGARSGTVCLITASGFKHTFAGEVPSPKSDLAAAERVSTFLSAEGISGALL
jgi:threonine synthase